ncbi:MAG: FG-GAP-like repeat-containing protein, partial [Myxococcota bacterium]|nr:FG-GAP-like repeat-containing protein [Myxococcota bacterium]MEC8425613.1 FG-GAP-like repeat-containing protein [Myxococcota bacterium]
MPGWVASDRGVATGAAAVDLDGDGFDELVASYGNDIEPGPVVVYDNDEGRLLPTPTWRSAVDGYHAHIAVGDVDGDGDPDVIVSRYLGDSGWGSPGGVDLYENVDGVLTPSPVWIRDGLNSFSCALGDVDRDGDLDLAVAAGEAYQGRA